MPEEWGDSCLNQLLLWGPTPWVFSGDTSISGIYIFISFTVPLVRFYIDVSAGYQAQAEAHTRPSSLVVLIAQIPAHIQVSKGSRVQTHIAWTEVWRCISRWRNNPGFAHNLVRAPKGGLACPACSRDTNALRVSTGLSEASCCITFATVAQARKTDTETPSQLLCHIKAHENRRTDSAAYTALPQAFATKCCK